MLSKHSFILLFCYLIYVNENYTLTVCEIEERSTGTIIEVTEGDGYKQQQSISYKELVEHTQELLSFDSYD